MDRFCDDLGIDSAANFKMSIKIMLLVFQKNLELQKSYIDIWPAKPFINLEMVDQVRAMKILKNASAWKTLLQYVNVNAENIK